MLNIFLKIIILLFLIYFATGFNISPQPNIVFNRTFEDATRSSYFGFTINLRESSIFIGAPRAQTSKNIKESGAIYKCFIDTPKDCLLMEIDKGIHFVDLNDPLNINSPKEKDYQWLGASMDGGNKNTDKLVVCAPRLRTHFKDFDTMHGICYWTKNTHNLTKFHEIAPLRAARKQTRENEYIYLLGQEGISVHVASDNGEILIGAPGIETWKGSIIRHNNHTEVLSPKLWKQDNISYFGYSVGSGHFDSANRKKVYYLASAPQANIQSGEAYIFDILKTFSEEHQYIHKYFTFFGSQFGEYFGYAVLAEDLNADGLTDVIITAPLYGSESYFEQGAMYVFINKGKFVFELQKKIISPVEGRGRFGTSISKLGDINRDGFNDIAVGAPFAGNGTVFIFLGSSKGLREVHSQKIEADPVATSWGSQMFGHGLSKGSDIDNNGFNDFAIGAPNAESVFVYRAYPVVKIHATITSLKREFKPEHTKFQIEICYMISTNSEKVKSQDLTIRVSVDSEFKRVILDNSAEHVLTVTALTQKQCRKLNASLVYTPAYIFKPMKLEIFYDLTNRIPSSEVFCDKCAVVDPADAKSISEKFVFSTGCKTDICSADLKVTSSGLGPTYILGSNRTMSVTYTITNLGDEKAYLPQFNITSSNNMPFAKTPSSCHQNDGVLLCDINRGQPMNVSEEEHITIVFDVTEIEGSSITLTAVVSSAGKEQNPSDNIVSDLITLQEFTEIEAIGKPLTPHINLETVFNSAEIINSYKIKSSGPSKIEELEITFDIPIAQKFYGSSEPVSIVNVYNITVQGVYNGQPLNAMFYQNNSMLLVNSNALLMSSIVTQNGNQFVDQPLPKNKSEALGEKSEDELLSFEQMKSLPISRTIVFSCINPEITTCARAVIKVNNFVPDMPINGTLKYHVDLNEVNKVLSAPWEFFVILTKLEIVKVGDKDGNSTDVQSKMEYNVITKRQMYSTPLWLISSAIFGGLLVLTVITYGMYRIGFFRRKTNEELQKLVQELHEAEHDKLCTFSNSAPASGLE